MALRNIRYIGIAPDPGGTVPQPWFYIDGTEVGLDSPSETDVEIPSMLGMSARRKRAGAYIPEGSLAHNTDIFALGYWLKWSLMGYAYTAPLGGATPTGFFGHEIWANDIRYFEKLCARIGKDEFEHIFESVVIGSLEMNVEREFLELSAETTAGRDSEGVIKNVNTDIIPKLPPEYALMFHDINLFIDRSGVTPINVSDIAMSLSSTVENNTDAERGVRLGSRFSRSAGSSGRNVTLSTELDFVNMNQKRAFWGFVNAQGRGEPGKLGSKTFPVEAFIDSGSVFGAVDNFGTARLLWPKCYYNTVPTAPSGREEMSNEVEMNVLEDSVTLKDATQVQTSFYASVDNLAPNLNTAPTLPRV